MRGRASGRGGSCGTPDAEGCVACMGDDAAKSDVSGAPDGGVGGSAVQEDGADALAGFGGSGVQVWGRGASPDATSGREAPPGSAAAGPSGSAAADGEVDAGGGAGTGPTAGPSRGAAADDELDASGGPTAASSGCGSAEADVGGAAGPGATAGPSGGGAAEADGRGAAGAGSSA